MLCLLSEQWDGDQGRRWPPRCECRNRMDRGLLNQSILWAFTNQALLSQQPPPPSLPQEETEEEKGLRRLFEQLAGDVRLKRSVSHLCTSRCRSFHSLQEKHGKNDNIPSTLAPRGSAVVFPGCWFSSIALGASVSSLLECISSLKMRLGV